MPATSEAGITWENRAELVDVVAAGDPEQGHAADAMSKISRFARGRDRGGMGARGWVRVRAGFMI
jgi:hypothetical protein